MSKLEKLSILGVRSFANSHSEVLYFYTPLTLVVGQNGSGKTTIIECLKYAITGMLPPNSKGGAFIHDPKLVNEREVMAQVRLSFKAATGATMSLTRSLQLTVKKLTRQQKTLEAQLLMVKEGERTAISSRVAELDQIIPQYLGVSAAVIDNVIFCHQDESLWPMSEPSVLKKKFDEIFEAQKYTKAIENIKQLRKKQNEELAKFKIIEQHAKQDKASAEKTEKQMVKLQDELETLRAEFNELGEKMNEASQLAHDAAQRYNTFDAMTRSLETEKKSAESTKQLLDSLRSTMKELKQSDEELTNTLDQFDSRIEKYEQDRDTRLAEFQRGKNHLEKLQAEKGAMLAKKGKAEAQKAQYETQLGDRAQLAQTVARQHNMRGYDQIEDQALFDNFLLATKKISRDRATALSRAREEADGKRKEAQVALNRLEQRQKALQDGKLESKKVIAQNDLLGQQLRNNISRIGENEGSSAVFESRIEEANSRLDKSEKDSKDPARREALNQASMKITQSENLARRLREELVESTKRSSEVAEITHLKKSVQNSEKSLQTLKNVHAKKIKKVLGSDVDPSTIETEYQTVYDSLTRDLSSAEQAQSSAARLLEQGEFRAKTVEDSIKKKEQIRRDAENKIRKAIDDEPSELETVLAERQSALNDLKEDSAGAEAQKKFLQGILEAAIKKKSCKTCSRPFTQAEDLKRFKEKIENLLRDDPAEQAEAQIAELEAELQSARNATIDYEMWKQANDELPGLTEDRKRALSECDQLRAKLETRETELQQCQEARKELESQSKTIQSISKHASDIAANEATIEQLAEKQAGLESARTLDEIQDEMTEAEKQTAEARELAQRLAKEGESLQGDISRLRLELSRLRGELSNCNFQLEKKASLEAALEKVQAATARQRDVMNNADGEIDKLDAEIATASATCDDIDQTSKAVEKDLRTKAEEIAGHLQNLEYYDKMVQDYLNAGGLEELDKIERALSGKVDEMVRSEAAQNENTREINRLKEQMDQSEAVRRNYSDNLQHRSLTRKYQASQQEIASLTSQVSNESPDKYKREAKRRDDEKHFYSGQREGKMGEMKSKDNQLADLLRDYESDFKDAARKYKEGHIRTETCKAAVEDLARYGSALDRAIMTYHALKMQEINRIIEELWQRTYQGTDVDTIVIRSDNENAKGNRNYNYRVCMVKQDVEMDMRGRCSAGQKVLASIIIRIALTESFGHNMLALDEPTTNLDQDNIRALAESLSEIIAHRRQQTNFQLIVITHDEEFLKHMKSGEFCDFYYRVSRDERQKSIIRRQDVGELL